MAMRNYEDMKEIVIPKEQEEMMNIICEAWEECHSLRTCTECKDRPKNFMRMAMCTALKYTRKLVEAGYTRQPTADVQEVRHGKWLPIKAWFDDDYSIESNNERYQTGWKCSLCGRIELIKEPYCHCGAKMDLEE